MCEKSRKISEKAQIYGKRRKLTVSMNLQFSSSLTRDGEARCVFWPNAVKGD